MVLCFATGCLLRLGWCSSVHVERLLGSEECPLVFAFAPFELALARLSVMVVIGFYGLTVLQTFSEVLRPP